MINNLAIRMITLAAGLSALPFALSVCPPFQIAIGTSIAAAHSGHITFIYTNECRFLDTLDGYICGSGYVEGAEVQCKAGTKTPNTVRLGDGSNWGNCVSTTESCGNGLDVNWCCSSELPRAWIDIASFSTDDVIQLRDSAAPYHRVEYRLPSDWQPQGLSGLQIQLRPFISARPNRSYSTYAVLAQSTS
ncbi:hypothetical protein JB92DRAFT_3302158 [Gautieria morchelliformis]|nr:hypothetical protein JB92DRAFT_3302158 [Gautieria morchelliformis]